MLRVDGDNKEDGSEDEAELQVSPRGHYLTHSSAEIMVRMDPFLRGVFRESDHDLLLVLDSEHFTRNKDAIN